MFAKEEFHFLLKCLHFRQKILVNLDIIKHNLNLCFG